MDGIQNKCSMKVNVSSDYSAITEGKEGEVPNIKHPTDIVSSPPLAGAVSD